MYDIWRCIALYGQKNAHNFIVPLYAFTVRIAPIVMATIKKSLFLLLTLVGDIYSVLNWPLMTWLA